MKYWLVPANDSIFRIGDAMAAQSGIVDWRTSMKFAVGDVAYIYKTSPEKRIRYRMEVVKINFSIDDAFEQEPYWSDKSIYYDGLGSFNYTRFKLVEEYTDDTFSLHHLNEHGLRGYIQGVMECKSQELLDFLQNPQTINDDVYDVDYPEEDADLYEGALMKVMANKYERNQKARRKCVELKGYRCAVCGFDFVEHYGEIGKGFIHVHHLIPISSIGKEYKLDPVEDLVPVCPNCHYMLHRKDPPFTPDELKKEMDSKMK